MSPLFAATLDQEQARKKRERLKKTALYLALLLLIPTLISLEELPRHGLAVEVVPHGNEGGGPGLGQGPGLGMGKGIGSGAGSGGGGWKSDFATIGGPGLDAQVPSPVDAPSSGRGSKSERNGLTTAREADARENLTGKRENLTAQRDESMANLKRENLTPTRENLTPERDAYFANLKRENLTPFRDNLTPNRGPSSNESPSAAPVVVALPKSSEPAPPVESQRPQPSPPEPEVKAPPLLPEAAPQSPDTYQPQNTQNRAQ